MVFRTIIQEESRQVESVSRFKFIVSALTQQRQTASEEAARDPASEEIEKYFIANHKLALHEDPLVFWQDYSNKYPMLSVLAQDILVIPATFAPVERLVSQASVALAGKRNRLSG